MSGNVRIDLKGANPIPVGHLVEVWLLRVDEGRFSVTNGGPMVRHLETGIVYGPNWAFEKPGLSEERGAAFSLDLRPEVLITAHWKGRVVLCRILTTDNDHLDQTTTLVLAPQAP